MRPLVAFKAFLAIFFWGASFVATKVVLRELSRITIISVRFVLGLVTLIPIVSLKHEWRHLFVSRATGHARRRGAAVG